MENVQQVQAGSFVARNTIDKYEIILVIAAWIMFVMCIISGFILGGYYGGIGKSIGNYVNEIPRSLADINLFGNSSFSLPVYKHVFNFETALLGSIVCTIIGLYILSMTYGIVFMWRDIKKISNNGNISSFSVKEN